MSGPNPVRVQRPSDSGAQVSQQNKDENFIRIDLTDAQKIQIKQATGKDAESIELNAQELEERIAPRVRY